MGWCVEDSSLKAGDSLWLRHGTRVPCLLVQVKKRVEGSYITFATREDHFVGGCWFPLEVSLVGQGFVILCPPWENLIFSPPSFYVVRFEELEPCYERVNRGGDTVYYCGVL